MNGRQLGRSHRAIRHRQGQRQNDVSLRSGVGRWKIVMLEAGETDGLRFGDVSRCFEALDARLEVRATWHGAALDRLLDEGHARLVGRVVGLLRRLGWVVEVEVSFSRYGERGSIDLLGWHPGRRVLAVFEVKSELGAVDGLLRPLDVKVRLAPAVVRQRFGWDAATVGRIVVLPEDRTARRAVQRHETVLSTALPARSREVRQWLRAPSGVVAGIWFLTDVGPVNARRNPSAVRRVRRARPRSAEDA
jgi:hypothetical protein